jgi:hypothetical protein
MRQFSEGLAGVRATRRVCNRQEVRRAACEPSIAAGPVAEEAVRSWFSCQYFHIIRLETGDRLTGNGSVRSDQASSVRDCQAQQVKIGEMLRTGLGEIEALRLEKAERVGPEAVAFDADEFDQDAAQRSTVRPGNGYPGLLMTRRQPFSVMGQVAQPWLRCDLNQVCAEA